MWKKDCNLNIFLLEAESRDYSMRQIILLLFVFLLVCCRDEGSQTQSESNEVGERKTVLLFVRIPDPVMPLERVEKYEEPLNEFLVAKSLGEVTGGGSMLSELNTAGQRSIMWVGIDVDVYDPDKAIPFLIEKLKELGVPEGTIIEQSEPVERTIAVK